MAMIGPAVHPDYFMLDNRLWVISQPTGLGAYDFDFRQFFPCQTPYNPPSKYPGVLRIGPITDYQEVFSYWQEREITLVNNPEQHQRCSELPLWYPRLKSLTPRSVWYDSFPTFKEVEENFTLPIFIKGARQTSRHNASFSIIRTKQEFAAAAESFKSDPILHRQACVCREFTKLRSVKGGPKNSIPPSFEFRTFWWRGQCVGSGRYWTDSDPYQWTATEESNALQAGSIAAQAMDCPFIVLDLAQTEASEWIVIESNAAMESGYAGVSPFSVWQNILREESTT